MLTPTNQNLLKLIDIAGNIAKCTRGVISSARGLNAARIRSSQADDELPGIPARLHREVAEGMDEYISQFSLLSSQQYSDPSSFKQGFNRSVGSGAKRSLSRAYAASQDNSWRIGVALHTALFVLDRLIRLGQLGPTEDQQTVLKEKQATLIERVIAPTINNIGEEARRELKVILSREGATLQYVKEQLSGDEAGFAQSLGLGEIHKPVAIQRTPGQIVLGLLQELSPEDVSACNRVAQQIVSLTPAQRQEILGTLFRNRAQYPCLSTLDGQQTTRFLNIRLGFNSDEVTRVSEAIGS